MPPLFPRVSPNGPPSINDSALGVNDSTTAPASPNPSSKFEFPAAALVFIIWASFICGLCIAGVVGKCLEKVVRNKNKTKGNTIKKPKTLGSGNARGDRAWVEGFLSSSTAERTRAEDGMGHGASVRRVEGVEMNDKLPSYEEISVPELVHHGTGSVETLPRYQIEGESHRIVRLSPIA